MNESGRALRVALLSGLATAAATLGPLLVTLPIVAGINQLSGPDHPGLGLPIFLAAGLVGGAWWGATMGGLAGAGRVSEMRVAGASSIAPAILAAVWLLIALDPILGRWGFKGLATHHQFLLIFVASAFLVAALSAHVLALGLAPAARWPAGRNSLLTGLAAAAAFLLVALAMDAIGYRVGAPRPGLRPAWPPMPFVTIVSTFAGCLAGGGALGWLLFRHAAPAQAAAPEAAGAGLET